MRIRKGLILRQVGGNSVVMGEGLSALEFGKMLTLNETAAWLWQQAERMGEFSVDSLAACMAEEYDMNVNDVMADVEEMVNEWKKVGAIDFL